MKQALKKHQEAINTAINNALNNDLEQAGTLGKEVNERLKSFATKGKGVRGGLVCATYQFYHETIPQNITDTAAGIELIHAGLLIHDDIMDEDHTRRGMAASHEHYAQLHTQHPNPRKAGESLAICEGDIAYFLGYTLLDHEVARKIIHDIALVGVAQMHDIANEHQEPTVADVMRCYEYKTARYTFSMPMWAGATLAGEKETADKLYQAGIHAGILYQLRDDELGLYGNPDITGKPRASDLRQGKHTIHTALLKEHTSTEDYEIARKKSLTQSPEDIDWVVNLITTSGAKKRAQELMDKHAQHAQDIINTTNLAQEHKQFLKEVIAYCRERQK